MPRLYQKKINHFQVIKKKFASRKKKIFFDDIKWVFDRFAFYSAGLLAHGYTLFAPNTERFILKYEFIDNPKKVEREGRFVQSEVIHGLYFTVESEGKMEDEFKAKFKPSFEFRQRLQEHLNDPDLTYKLIS